MQKIRAAWQALQHAKREQKRFNRLVVWWVALIASLLILSVVLVNPHNLVLYKAVAAGAGLGILLPCWLYWRRKVRLYERGWQRFTVLCPHYPSLDRDEDRLNKLYGDFPDQQPCQKAIDLIGGLQICHNYSDAVNGTSVRLDPSNDHFWVKPSADTEAVAAVVFWLKTLLERRKMMIIRIVSWLLSQGATVTTVETETEDYPRKKCVGAVVHFADPDQLGADYTSKPIVLGCDIRWREAVKMVQEVQSRPGIRTAIDSYLDEMEKEPVAETYYGLTLHERLRGECDQAALSVTETAP